MESRANYAAIGLFVLIMLVGGLGFVYWLTNAGEKSRQANIRVVFAGAVTGLNTGSNVMFNGIKVGEVVDLSLDEQDPNTVVAIINVDRTKPIRTDTRAILSYQGLTGVANLQLEGGSRNAPLLLETVLEPGSVPTLQAEVSPFQDIMESARNVLTRADSAMAAIDDFVAENGPAFNRTVNNIETFSKALADNADGIDEALANVSKAANSLGEISGSIAGAAARAEEILAAIEPARVAELTERLTSSAAELDGLLKRAGEVAGGVDPKVINEAVANVAAASETLRQTLDRADAVLAEVDPTEIDRLVENLNRTTEDVGAAVRRADGLIAAVDPQTVTGILGKVDTTVTALADVSDTVGGTLERIGAVVSAVDPAKVGVSVEGFSDFAASLKGAGPQVDAILADAKSASESLRRLGETVDARNGDIDSIIVQAETLSGQLNDIAGRADGLLARLDGYVEGDGEGLVAEATATLKSVRTVADTLAGRIGPITDNVAQFTDRGLDSYVRLAEEGRRALARLDRVLSGVERNPQQFIFGGEGVPEYGTRRR